MRGDLERQLDQLEAMASEELKSRWRDLPGTPAPKVSPSLMRLALAWELQARALGALSRRTRQKLDQLAAGKTHTAIAAPGMRLMREWNGTVLVAHAGSHGHHRRARGGDRRRDAC